jgi:hypothetical protein
VTFHCTSKAQERLRLGPVQLARTEAPTATDWYCNLITLGRRPVFLFAHTLSLFAVLVPAAGSSSPGALGDAFREQARELLASEGYRPDHVRKVIDDGPDFFGRASDRRILGSMVDLAHLSAFVVADEGSLDLRRCYDQIHVAPMSLLGMESPRQVLKNLLVARGDA